MQNFFFFSMYLVTLPSYTQFTITLYSTELHSTGNAGGASVSIPSFRHPPKALNQSAKPRLSYITRL
jgi:hypothetical protein